MRRVIFWLGLLLVGVLYLAGCTLLTMPGAPPSASPVPTAAASRVNDIALLGVITVPNDTLAFATRVGGLSAVDYDAAADVYYFLSDDRAMFGPARIYQATIDLSDGTLDAGDLAWTGLVALRDEAGEPFAARSIDPEGLVWANGTFYLSTEGEAGARPMIDPAILHFDATGTWLAALPVPVNYLPVTDGSRGVRNNRGFESLTLTPDGRTLISGLENALAQDGPAATLETGSPTRLIALALDEPRVVSEYLYWVEPIPAAPTPATGDADNGLVELVALDGQGTLLALERSYVQGVGNTVRLYWAQTQAATDVRGLDALPEEEAGQAILPVTKELLVDFGELGRGVGIAPDNLEGMALGPQLADGRRVLVVVSDNNFNPTQTTQVWILALTVAGL